MIKIPDRLFKIIDNLKTLGSAESQDKLKQALAEQELKNIGIRFDTETDPSGASWEPRKDNKDHKLLDLTGKLKGSFNIKKGEQYSIVNSSGYAGFHQSGTSKMPARKFFDEDKSSSPEENKEIVFKHLRDWISK